MSEKKLAHAAIRVDDALLVRLRAEHSRTEARAGEALPVSVTHRLALRVGLDALEKENKTI